MSTSYPIARQVVRVPQDSTTATVTVKFHNANGTVRDLSGATGSKYFHASTEDGVNVTRDAAATFSTDGTDGQVVYSLTPAEVGTVQNLRCEFEVQGLASENIVSEMFTLMVLERARVAP